MKMTLTKKTKNKAKNKLKKIAFKIIKPFLPFILIIVGIIFALCTVVDALFTTEDDMQIAEQLSNNNYEEQYSEWLQERGDSQNIINGDGLIPTRYVYMAHSWIYKNNLSFWYENASNYWCL